MDLGPFEFLCGLAGVLLLVHYLLTSSLNFWKIRGVKGPKPLPFFGNFKDSMLLKCSLPEQLNKIYKEYPDEKVVGIFFRNKPTLLLKDPDIIKDVLIKDFSSWMCRNRVVHKKTEPFSQNLVSLGPKSWRPLRMKLTPIFTSGKLKEMFYILAECGDHLSSYIKDLKEPVEVRELTAKYTTDVIGNCAFGLQMNAIADEKSEFREMGRKVFKMNWFKYIRFTIRESFPKIYDYLYPVFKDTETTDFFTNCMKQTIEYREKNNLRRQDFLDNLRDIRNTTKNIGDMEVTDTFLAAQAFIFFLAGFETSSSTMSFTLYELAQNQHIQDKLRAEILDELKKNDGKLTYDSVQSMKYLNQVFQESLRKHPPAPHLSRRSVTEYTFAGTNIKVPADQTILVPVYSIHHNPEFYPKPEVFDPERFNEENVKKRHQMTYLPFGDGPRNCIGSRFAINQSKVGLIKILQNHKVDICDKTEIPYTLNPSSLLLTPKNGIHLKFTTIN